ncbi:MAG: hypothetical protein ACI9SC_000043 [Gammaproteobacteria bacterium]|jgi:hypothetical protein
MIRIFTNIFLIAFLLDGSLSLFDELASLYFEFPTITLVRNYFADLVILGAIPLYFIVGLNARLPKVIFFSLIFFVFWCVFQAYPLSLYFDNRYLTLPLSIIQVLIGLGAFLSIRTMTGGAWFLSKESLNGPAFVWRQTLIFVLVNVLLVPALLIVLLWSAISSTLLDSSGGFVRLSTQGIYLSDKEYQKDNKVVRLVGMVHIGESEYYRELYKSILKTDTIVLKEGVTDKHNLFRSVLPYSQIARYLGLQQQPFLEIEPERGDFGLSSTPGSASQVKRARIIDADIDIQSFSPETLEFLNHISLSFAETDSFIKGVKNYFGWDSENMTEERYEIIIKDIIEKRNTVLLRHLHSALLESDSIIIPWGAMHMPEIQADLLDKGFAQGDSTEHLAIEFF